MYCHNCGKQVAEDAKFCPYCGKAVAMQVSASPPTPPTPTPAATSSTSSHATGFDKLTSDSEAQSHWVSRLVAFIIDVVLVSIVVLIAYGVFALPLLLTGISNPVGVFFGFSTLGIFYSGLLMFLYASFAEAMYGGTLGKRILKLKVVSTRQQKVSLSETLVRNVAKLYWLLLLLDVLAGLLTQGDYRQRYTDRIANTVVVKE